MIGNEHKWVGSLIVILVLAGLAFLLVADFLPVIDGDQRTRQGAPSENKRYFIEPTNQSCTVRVNSYTIPIRYHFNNATCNEGILSLSQNGVTNYTVETDKDNVTFTKNETGIQITKRRGEDEYLPVIKPKTTTNKSERVEEGNNV